MIIQFQIKNFKGHRDTSLALKQLTVLVGDNGSGKTSVLEAFQLPNQLLASSRSGPRSHTDEWLVQRKEFVQELEDVLRRGADRFGLSYAGTVRGRPWATEIAIVSDSVSQGSNAPPSGQARFSNFDANLSVNRLGEPLALREPVDIIGKTVLYRFRADQIAKAAYSDQPNALVGEDGELTAVVLAALKLADDEAFDKIEHAMQRIIPSMERLRLRPAEVKHPSNPNPVTGTKLYFDFAGAAGIPAHHASQGTLVLLALLTVLYSPRRPNVILLDDFDHSLHPRAQMELMRMIKELLELDDFKETQIIVTTHSPYVLDEVPPENVIAFALRDDGTVAAKPLSEHPDASKVNGSLKSGELWSLDPERNWVR